MPPVQPPPPMPLPPFQILPEEPYHGAPRRIRDLGLLARAQETVSHAGIDRVWVVLPRRLHRGGRVRETRVDARVVLGVDAEPPSADARHVRRVRGGTVTDDEG